MNAERNDQNKKDIKRKTKGLKKGKRLDFSSFFPFDHLMLKKI